MPSSPYGPCSSGSTTSTSPSALGIAPGSCTVSSRAVGSAAIVSSAPLVSSIRGGRFPSVIANCSLRPSASTHRPSVEMPTGTTS